MVRGNAERVQLCQQRLERKGLQESLHPSWVGASVFFWGESRVGQVAAPAAGHEQLFTNFSVMVKEGNVRPASGSSEGGENAGGTCSDNANIHSKIIPAQVSSSWLGWN